MAVLLAPGGFELGRLSLAALLPNLQIVLLGDLIRTGLSRQDMRTDRMLNVVALGVVVAIDRNVYWVPVALLAVATAELILAGSYPRRAVPSTFSPYRRGGWRSRPTRR